MTGIPIARSPGSRSAHRAPRRVILCVILLPLVMAGQEASPPPPPAVSNPGMQRQLEGLYQSWRDAMDRDDFQAWQQVTAQARQGEIRNQIVSQRLPYPEALFEIPMQAPKLEGLTHVDTLTRGDTASSVYFGLADFGVSEVAEVRENFIVLRYIREFGVWKFDNLRVVKFGDDPSVLLKLRNGDNSFLEAPEFQPAPVPPPIPGPVNAPDYIAELWVTAVGYEVKLSVNAQHHAAIANDSGRELINGGLVKGANRLSVTVKEIPVDAGTPRHIEIAIYGAQRPTDEAKRFYHYRSTPGSEPENFMTNFAVPGS